MRLAIVEAESARVRNGTRFISVRLKLSACFVLAVGVLERAPSKNCPANLIKAVMPGTYASTKQETSAELKRITASIFEGDGVEGKYRQKVRHWPPFFGL